MNEKQQKLYDKVLREAAARGDDVTRVVDPTALSAGTRVKLLYPYSYWGEGVVIGNDPGRTWINPDTGRKGRAKPLEIRRDDGCIGWFNYDALLEVV